MLARPAIAAARSSPKIRADWRGRCCSKPASTSPLISSIRRRVSKGISGGFRRLASASASARSPSFRSTAGSSIAWRSSIASGALVAPAHGDWRQYARRRGHRHRHEDSAAGGGGRSTPRSRSASRPSCRTPRTRTGWASTPPTSTHRCWPPRPCSRSGIVGNFGSRHPGGPDRRRSPERRADLRTVVRARADRSCRGGRGAERPGLDTRRHGVSGNRNPRAAEFRRPLHSRVDSPGRRPVLGLTTIDPTIGFTTGLTYVFNAFQVP